ncbi:MAG: glycoside hydrolase family 15 protein [Gemmatimonadota bacterium]
MSDYSPISDYAVIGNCRTAALIGRTGSIDWLCLPRFDGGSVFGALLDAQRGGRFQIRPVAPARVERRYIPHTNVLATTFTTPTGALIVRDCMPAATEREKARQLWPEHEILRMVECTSGEVEVEVLCDPRPEYGQCRARLLQQGALGFLYEHGRSVLAVRSEMPLEPDTDGALRGRTVLRAGEIRFVSVCFDQNDPVILSPLGGYSRFKLDITQRWWRDWTARCDYHGPYRDAVVRSALALKLLTFAPSGAVVAAVTSSLPEKIGGNRNWDYRYCWLRDASLTVRAFFELDYHREAESFLAWLLHATALTWPELRVLYDVYGETRLRERELPHLEGYMRSAPVRVGNGACDQLQLDVYAEVIGAAYHFIERGGRLDRAAARLLNGLGRTVCRRWREPDEGLWEIRAGRRHHTVSKAMCWVALDLMLRMHDQGHIRVPAQEFRRERAALRAAIEAHGYNNGLGSYVAVFDSDVLDASLLLLSLHGYADASSERMRGTHARVRERLGAHGLLYRYLVPDGLPEGEGTFTLCSFWAVIHLALAGQLERAQQEFEYLLRFANDVGLFSEEIEPATGAALGNFPQAFTHLGLINAAVTLEQCAGQGPSRKSVAAPEKRDVRV